MQKFSIKLAHYMLAVAAIILASIPAEAQDAQMGYTTYYFNDSGGNTVATTSFNLAKKIFSRTVLLLDLEVDNVTVPPVTAVTGATRPKRQSSKSFEKTRGQAILGIEQALTGNTTLATTIYRSQEVDYTSNSAILKLTREMFQKNTTISLRGQYIMDQVGEVEDDGSITNRSKNTIWAVAGFSQILSPTTVFSANYDAVYLEGFLSDPYRTVQVFDENNAFVAVQEKHPGNRLRQAASARLNKMIPNVGAALMFGYRYYFDDWGVASQTGEFQFSKYIFGDLITRFNYRLYTQNEAEFTLNRYRGTEFTENAFRTADYKLNSFYSNNFGISLTLMFREFVKKHRDFNFLKNSSIEFRYFRYFNSLDFSANIYQLNIDFGI